MKNHPAEVFHPGEFLKDEIEAREWTWRDFVDKSGIDYLTLCDLIDGRQGLTAELAERIGAAFGTSADLWMNLQASWDAQHRRLIPYEDAILARLRTCWGLIDLGLNVEHYRGEMSGIWTVLWLCHGEDTANRLREEARKPWEAQR